MKREQVGLDVQASEVKQVNPNPSSVIQFQPLQTAVLLVNLGTPLLPTHREVTRFLKEFLADPCVVDLPKILRWALQLILPFRAKRVVKLYQSIWMKEGSPLKVYSHRLGEGLQGALQETIERYNTEVTVHVAMTYGNPNIIATVNEILNNKIDRLIVLPLFPQYSKATTKPIWNKLCDALKHRLVIPDFHFINEYANNHLYIQALAESIAQFWRERGKSEQLLFSFHGVPVRNLIQGDTYPTTCRALALRVAEELKIPENSYAISFQSRFGLSPWMRPYTDQQLRDWAGLGVKSVDVVSPSFAVDCLETLEELDIGMRHLFLASGGEKYQYIPALNDNQAHIEALKGLIIKFF